MHVCVFMHLFIHCDQMCVFVYVWMAMCVTHISLTFIISISFSFLTNFLDLHIYTYTRWRTIRTMFLTLETHLSAAHFIVCVSGHPLLTRTKSLKMQTIDLLIAHTKLLVLSFPVLWHAGLWDVQTTLICHHLDNMAGCTGVGKYLYVRQYVQVWRNICIYCSMYRCGETFACMAVCTGVGKYLYVWQYAQVWENTCMYGSMYWCGEIWILVCVALFTGVGKYKYLYVWQYVQVWWDTCMCSSMHRCGETFAPNIGWFTWSPDLSSFKSNLKTFLHVYNLVVETLSHIFPVITTGSFSVHAYENCARTHTHIYIHIYIWMLQKIAI